MWYNGSQFCSPVNRLWHVCWQQMLSNWCCSLIACMTAGICAVLKQARATQVIKLSAIKVSHCKFCLLHMLCAVMDSCFNHVAFWDMSCPLFARWHTACHCLCEGSLCCGLRMLCYLSSIRLTEGHIVSLSWSAIYDFHACSTWWHISFYCLWPEMWHSSAAGQTCQALRYVKCHELCLELCQKPYGQHELAEACQTLYIKTTLLQRGADITHFLMYLCLHNCHKTRALLATAVLGPHQVAISKQMVWYTCQVCWCLLNETNRMSNSQALLVFRKALSTSLPCPSESLPAYVLLQNSCFLSGPARRWTTSRIWCWCLRLWWYQVSCTGLACTSWRANLGSVPALESPLR